MENSLAEKMFRNCNCSHFRTAHRV